MNINNIIANTLYLILTAIGGFIYKEYKSHNKILLEFKKKEEDRAIQLLGQENYNKDKQLVVDTIYKVEQLAKEQLQEKWTGIDKHAKVLELIAGKTGLKDEDVYDIIKITVSMLNSNKPK